MNVKVETKSKKFDYRDVTSTKYIDDFYIIIKARSLIKIKISEIIYIEESK